MMYFVALRLGDGSTTIPIRRRLFRGCDAATDETGDERQFSISEGSTLENFDIASAF